MGAASMARLHAIALWISCLSVQGSCHPMYIHGRCLRGPTHLDLAQATHSAGPWLAAGKPLRGLLDRGSFFWSGVFGSVALNGSYGIRIGRHVQNHGETGTTVRRAVSAACTFVESRARLHLPGVMLMAAHSQREDRILADEISEDLAVRSHLGFRWHCSGLDELNSPLSGKGPPHPRSGLTSAKPLARAVPEGARGR